MKSKGGVGGGALEGGCGIDMPKICREFILRVDRERQLLLTAARSLQSEVTT